MFRLASTYHSYPPVLTTSFPIPHWPTDEASKHPPMSAPHTSFATLTSFCTSSAELQFRVQRTTLPRIDAPSLEPSSRTVAVATASGLHASPSCLDRRPLAPSGAPSLVTLGKPQIDMPENERWLKLFNVQRSGSEPELALVRWTLQEQRLRQDRESQAQVPAGGPHRLRSRCSDIDVLSWQPRVYQLRSHTTYAG